MSKMTHLIKYKQIFYQIINENALKRVTNLNFQTLDVYKAAESEN